MEPVENRLALAIKSLLMRGEITQLEALAIYSGVEFLAERYDKDVQAQYGARVITQAKDLLVQMG